MKRIIIGRCVGGKADIEIRPTLQNPMRNCSPRLSTEVSAPQSTDFFHWLYHLFSLINFTFWSTRYLDPKDHSEFIHPINYTADNETAKSRNRDSIYTLVRKVVRKTDGWLISPSIMSQIKSDPNLTNIIIHHGEKHPDEKMKHRIKRKMMKKNTAH